ncbi:MULTISPECIES: GNAT family N-acetyltransferase [unclassified Listeria]|uniref:GNAT family N-acetyltransferase n=1 Tax=unclassified Listeria TaxID=2642072 RepID=UPI000B58D72F|nr:MULTISPECIES: GNAT family N-acetyltransferase [unclassified Listeria]
MEPLETRRLLLIEYTFEMIEATIKGISELEKVTGYDVSEEWPGIDFFFYLPYVLENVKNKPEMTKWTKLVVLKEEGIVIGEIGGQGNPDETGEIELGYSIVESYQGHGYMKEALAEMVLWLVAQKKITRIFARSFEHNLASIHVLQGTGFKYREGHDEMQLGGKITLWELDQT